MHSGIISFGFISTTGKHPGWRRSHPLYLFLHIDLVWLTFDLQVALGDHRAQ